MLDEIVLNAMKDLFFTREKENCCQRVCFSRCQGSFDEVIMAIAQANVVVTEFCFHE